MFCRHMATLLIWVRFLKKEFEGKVCPVDRELEACEIGTGCRLVGRLVGRRDGMGVNAPKEGDKVPRRSGMGSGAFGFLNDQHMACLMSGDEW
jgi:hypothetical protein